MQNRKPHSQKAPQTGHSIFGTILFSLLAVLAVEFLLLTFAVHATRLGPQLNQNAEDILAMQVDNRSRYLQSIFHDAQELTSLSDAINGLTQQLLDEGEISLSTLDSSSDAAYPLLEAAAPELISTLRIKSVTGVFLILNTHDLDERKQDSLMPAIYLRDLDPDAAPSQRNADLTFVRAPAQLVQSLSIATDNSWSPHHPLPGTGKSRLPLSPFPGCLSRRSQPCRLRLWPLDLTILSGARGHPRGHCLQPAPDPAGRHRLRRDRRGTAGRLPVGEPALL